MRVLPALIISTLLAGLLFGCGSKDDTPATMKDMSATSFDLAGADLSGPDLTFNPNLDFGGTVVGIACGDTPCAANAQFCCTGNQGKSGICGFGTSVNCGSAIFYCDGPEDCPPADPYCCVQNGLAQCGNSACAGSGASEYGMCHTAADCVAVGGGMCCPSTSGGPYRLCLATCP